MDHQLKNEHIEIIESYGRLFPFLLLRFDEGSGELKEKHFRNFIAKSFSLLESVKILVSSCHDGEAMALYRMQIERYLYLEYLIKTDSFKAFSDWSYVKAFDMRNNMRSEKDLGQHDDSALLKNSTEDVARYKKIKETGHNWHEPDLKKLAKELNLKIIYNFGYDVGSSYIHPRAEEGIRDCYRYVNKEIKDEWRLDRIIANSILICNSVLRLSIFYSNIDWGKYMNLYLNTISNYLSSESELPDLMHIEKQIVSNL